MRTNISEKFKRFKLDKNALSHLKGGGRWVPTENGKLIWVDK
ncbi:hypothetical protein CLV62_1377 [Dysgonomonas alginatilytica]|uniref:Uncharacterized protein n=1 Tax=Dysgonomonas alginatilytica TaxID=1605892 RepID=A0A2V3PKI5_9BACT|nr:hypothetical protein CLV62_1377 [Dysgonomonas alginatilytica]